MADWNWTKFGDDDDDDDNEEGGEGGFTKFQFGTRDGLIFLIDCTKSMFEKTDDESQFELCLKCAKSLIQNKIISSEKDYMGIVFFGTDKDKTPYGDFKHIYVLHDLELPGADKVLELESLIEEPGNDNFKAKYGHTKDYSLSDALWTCLNMFSNCKQKLGFKRVMLFTNNDNPHGNNAQLKKQAASKAEDLHQNGISLELMHLNSEGHVFDMDNFYKDILIPGDDETVAADPSETIEQLLTRVRAKNHKKRAISRVPLSLGEDLNMSVGVYNLARQCYKPSAVKLYKKTNEEIKAVTKTFLAETGEVLLPQDMKKAQNYGGKKICFEQEEVKEIKSFDVSGIKLMGFKPQSSLKKYFHVKPAQFLYPDESSITGSTTLFTAMLKKCLEKSVVAICRYIPRKNTPPRFVGLIPQEEELNDQHVQVTPPGFHVIFLPFADDFRKVKVEEDLPRANDDQISKAKELIKSLKFTFNSEQFENPALQQHYSNVEAMALDRDEPEEISDLTMPNEKRMDKRAGKIIEDFKDLVFPDGYVPGVKRRAPAGGAAAKKPKFDDANFDIENEAKNGKLGKLTVAVLREQIKKLGIKTTGTKKADLIDAVSDHFGL